MKRLGVLLLIVCCTLWVSSAFATPTYNMITTGGAVYGTDAFNKLNTALGTLPSIVWPGGATSAPPSYAGAATVSGYWEFSVDNSTANLGDPSWNDVMAGGDYLFNIDWAGTLSMGNNVVGPLSANFNMTDSFANIYGKWAENNSSMYTLFGLYVDPITGPASNGDVSPVGFFAFAGSASNSFDLTQILGNDFTVNAGGIGQLTATPEPTTLLLLGFGLLGMAGVTRKKN